MYISFYGKKIFLSAIIIAFSVYSFAQDVKNNSTPHPSKKIINQTGNLPDNAYQVKTFQIKPNEWGYNVYKLHQLLIHQPCIPVINGNKHFKNKKDAGKVATLVMKKLKNGIMPPTITIKELDSLKITY